MAVTDVRGRNPRTTAMLLLGTNHPAVNVTPLYIQLMFSASPVNVHEREEKKEEKKKGSG